MWAIEPPPAPTVWMSIDGSRTGKPATLRSNAISALPSRTRQTSVEVPPMSNVMRSPRPARAPACHGADDARGGPRQRGADRHLGRRGRPTSARPRTGRCRCRHPARAARRAACEPRHVAAGDRLQEGVEHGGGEPLVLAELGLHLAGERHVDVRAAPPAAPRPCAARARGLRNENRKQTATLSAPLSCTSAMARANVGVAERPDDLARRTDALGDLEAVLARHQRLGMVGLQVVDLGPGLAADLEQVLEAARW